MAKLSIIVPVYQVKLYLERCLNSILSQTFNDYEVILVDDGSTDGSQNICDTYAEKYDLIRVIHKQNGGLSSARNAGIENATGEYIMFVDSDDLIHSRSAELEIGILEENDADILICSIKRFSTEDEIDIYSYIEKSKNVSVVYGNDVERLLFNNPYAYKYVSSCGKAFKRSLFEDIRFPEGRLFEDEYTTYKLYYKSNKIIDLDMELYFYYKNASGITQNLNLNKRFDEYDAQVERIDFFMNNGNKELYHLGLMEFLHSAQWDLIKCQGRKQDHDHIRGQRLQKQYIDLLVRAEKEKLINFTNNYDYYVLAYPEKKTYYRLKRVILKTFRKNRHTIF